MKKIFGKVLPRLNLDSELRQINNVADKVAEVGEKVI